MKIVFLGTPDFVQPIKEQLSKHFTLVDSLTEADLAVVAAYGKILSKEELNLPKFGCINVHPSLLPKYRGPSPIQQAILNRDKQTGITIIKIDEEVDHGPIIYQDTLELSDIDNFDTLSKRLFQLSAKVLPKIIEDFTAGEITPVEQNHKEATYCEHLTRESGYFDINNPPSPEVLDKMIRAYFPWPGVWIKWSPSRHPEGAQRPKDLKIIKFLPGGLVQMEGKKAVSKKDFLNGYPNFPFSGY